MTARAALRRLARRIPEPWRRELTLRRARRWAAAAAHMRRHNQSLPANAPTLNFYPHRPAPNAKLYFALRELGMRARLAARADEPTICWDPYTVVPPRVLARLPANAINRGCVDVTKTRVDAAWQQVAGYGVSVDPLNWTGPLVVKSEYNGAHDGRLVQGPLAHRRAGLVYQRFIDTIVDGHARAQRLLKVGDEWPLVLDIHRPATSHFDGVVQARVLRAPDVFSADELRLLARFADGIGMEYGDIDVVRDRASGLIYAVDANRTPLGGAGMALIQPAELAVPLAASLGRLLANWRPLAE